VGGSGAAATPGGPAVGELEWVVGVLNSPSAPSTPALRVHFAPGFLKAIPPQQLVAALYPAWSERPVTVRVFRSAQPLTASATLATRGLLLQMSVAIEPNRPHRIIGLNLRPLAPKLTSWRAIDSALSRLGTHAELYVGSPDGGTIHAYHSSAPLAVGSAFKLYVLGALAQAIEERRAGWQEQLAISTAHKSLPAGGMAADRAGSEHSLREYAAQMISVSDNTAADHLIARLGRAAIERQLQPLGNQTPELDEPFLTTRELFALKLAAPAALRTAYAAGDGARRRALLPDVDALSPTVAEAERWSTPRLIDRIEWFASASDLSRAISTLVARSEAPNLAPLKAILINPASLTNPSPWSYVGYKGGSEPGVFSQTWYLDRYDGARFTVSLIVNDPRRPVDEAAAASIGQAVIAKLATNGRTIK
jgi:beta-lactamase class A